MLRIRLLSALFISLFFWTCGKKSSGNTPEPPPAPPAALVLRSWSIDENPSKSQYNNVSFSAPVKLVFSAPVDRSTVGNNVLLNSVAGTANTLNVAYSNGDSVLTITPAQPLAALTKYNLTVKTGLKSAAGGLLNTTIDFSIITALDPADKFPRISDDELLTLVQRQTFKYFWDFAHPVSGLARERNTSGDIVTSGG